MTLAPDNLFIDLSDIDVGDIVVLSTEGSRGIPELAASCTTGCGDPPQCSCAIITNEDP